VNPRFGGLTRTRIMQYSAFKRILNATNCMKLSEAGMSELKVNYQTHPSQYKHLKLSTEGNVARLSIDIDEDSGIRPGYKLKLNSYDLGVDIELNDALNRIRFEHPEVRCVVVSSAKDRIF